jgi:hypothetical protein
MKITNISSGPKSIWSAAAKEMVFVPAGATVEAEIDASEREAANPAWFSFELDPLDHDGDGRKGGAVEPDLSEDAESEPEPSTSPRPRGRPRKDA